MAVQMDGHFLLLLNDLFYFEPMFTKICDANFGKHRFKIEQIIVPFTHSPAWGMPG
jgi:hypothetical protein